MPDFEGKDFIGPLGFECAQCLRTTEILDTDKHGYHAEFGSAAKLSGTGPRQRFLCTQCSGEKVAVIVGFIYWDPEELLEDDPTIAIEDYFNIFLPYYHCATCHCSGVVTDLGKL